MRWIVALLLLLLPGLSAADPFPALYDVTGVAADDVLNIRAQPAADTEVIGVLTPGAVGVEVLRLSDTMRWGLVNAGETAGWVSMRYMARQPGQDWGVIPANLYCSGTEPFWSFELLQDGTARFATPEGAQAYAISDRVPGIASPGDFAFVAAGPAGRATGFVSSRACNDGMSDRAFGLSLGLLREGGGPANLYAGCCSLQR